MSLLFFEQRSDRLTGLFLLDADPEWTLSSPRREDGWIRLPLDTGEGRGPWLQIHPERGRWSAVLHRDDAPYNTCLPPGEALLVGDELAPDDSVDAWVESVADRCAASFVNPFDLVVGQPDSGELRVLEQSFEGRSNRLEPGVHVRPRGEARTGAADVLRENRPESPLSRNELKALAETSPGEDEAPLWVEDGRRPTRAAAVFEWSPDRFHLRHAAGPPGETGWRRVEVDPQR